MVYILINQPRYAIWDILMNEKRKKNILIGKKHNWKWIPNGKVFRHDGKTALCPIQWIGKWVVEQIRSRDSLTRWCDSLWRRFVSVNDPFGFVSDPFGVVTLRCDRLTTIDSSKLSHSTNPTRQSDDWTSQKTWSVCIIVHMERAYSMNTTHMEVGLYTAHQNTNSQPWQ